METKSITLYKKDKTQPKIVFDERVDPLEIEEGETYSLGGIVVEK